jgi:hypothetical protein
MITKIARVALVLTFGHLAGSIASAQAQTNTDTHCTSYDSTSMNCTSTSTTTQTGPTAAQVEQQKELNENMAKTGGALGSIIAMKRAQHAEEKSELTAVTFCRQNPYGTWTFPNKSPMPCATLEKNAIAYCSVNPNKHICKDIAKLPPASVQAVNPDVPDAPKLINQLVGLERTPVLEKMLLICARTVLSVTLPCDSSPQTSGSATGRSAKGSSSRPKLATAKT